VNVTSDQTISPCRAARAEEQWISFALDVARRSLTILTPDGYLDDEDPALSVTAEKVVAESAILLLAAARAARRCPALRRGVDALAERLTAVARTEAMRARLCTEPSVALDHACPHICLTAAGYPDPRYDTLIRAVLEGAIANGQRDRPPSQKLENGWLRDLLDAHPPSRSANDTRSVQDSALGRPLDTMTGTGEDAYALTHAVMFASDLGCTRIDLPRPADEIGADLDAALAVALDRHDYDIAGELLMCWPMLGIEWSPTAVFAYRLLETVHEQAGFVPTPIVDVVRYRKLDQRARTRYLLATTYHTIFVMGLLGATVIAVHKAPEPISATSRMREPAELLALLSSGEPAQWWTQYTARAEQERWALTPLLLTVALRRAIDSRDLNVVDDLVRVAEGSGISTLPAVQQASDLLYRAAVLAMTDWT
jgi:hypothetical protein